MLANNYLSNRPHKDLGSWWYVPTPIHFSRTPIEIRSEAPALGEHTDEVLAELGYSAEDIARLRAERTV